MKRRQFIKNTAIASSTVVLPSFGVQTVFSQTQEILPFKISLSQWAFQGEIFGDSRSNYKWYIKTLRDNPKAVLRGKMDPTDIVIKANELGVKGVDLVSAMLRAHRDDVQWLKNFKQKAIDNDVQFVCLMIDTLTKVASSNTKDKSASIDAHKRWIDAALELGCEHARVNPYSDGTYLQQLNRCAESLYTLSEYAQSVGMQLTIENHGHPGGNAAWMNMLIELTNHSNLGLFLDLGNFFMGGFNVQPRRWYDKTQGILDLAPFATGVSAKSRTFLPNGNEATIDYDFSMTEILKHGFNGWVSAEYDGTHLSDTEGSIKTIAKLRQLQHSLKR